MNIHKRNSKEEKETGDEKEDIRVATIDVRTSPATTPVPSILR